MSKKLLVGVFLVGGILLFGLGLFLVGNRKQAFSRHFEIYAEFANLSQLQSGAQIRVSGMQAGEVVEMEVPSKPSSRFRLKLKIDEKLHTLIRKNSVASIQTEGLVGNKYLEVDKGSEQSPEVREGETIPSREPFDWSDLMQQGNDLIKTTRTSIEDVRRNATEAIQSFNRVGSDADQMIVSIQGDIKKVTSRANVITGNINEMVAALNRGEGPAGKLLKDETLSARIDRTTANVEQATTRMNDSMADFQSRDLFAKAEAALENTRQVAEQVNQAVTKFLAGQGGEDAATKLQGTLASANRTMTNLADDTEAIKHNFFLRGFFKRRGYYNLDRMTPKEYIASRFFKNESAMRVWVPGEKLFSLKPDGTPQLTPEGRASLDRAVASLGTNITNRPMMIEGYSTYGLPEERYISSRQRAAEVRQYLQTEFYLNPALTGIMPFADAPPAGSGKSQWDGVALVMLR